MEDKITCPKCNSDQITASTNNFSFRLTNNGVEGIYAAVIDLPGATHIATCLQCGNQWGIKKHAELEDGTETLAHNKVDSKWNQKNNNWKKSFYEAYKKRDYATAEKIFFSREQHLVGITDVHAAYRLLKQLDHAQVIVVLGTAVFLVICLVGITQCAP